MSTLLQDIRYAFRMLAKRPGLTAVIVLTLTLGIGANSAVFSVVNGMWLRPLGYPEPDRLVSLFAANPRLMAANPTEGWDRSNVSANDFDDWRRLSRSFAGMGICSYASCNLTGGEYPERVVAARASAGLLPVLGYDAKIGCIFGPQEDQPGSEQVALLSDGFWQRRFGGDPSIVGQTIMLDGRPFEVLGVLPAELANEWRFDGAWGSFDVWIPFAFNANDYYRGNRSFKAVARLKPGISVAEAQAEIEAIAAHLAEAHPESNEGYTVNVMPLQDALVRDEAKQGMRVLTAAVAFVLLIACVNVANLLLANGSTRAKEYAIRAALGASKRRLIRQMITECTILSLAGATLGTLLAIWGVDILVAAIPDMVPRKHEIAVDRDVLLFTLVLSFVAAALFGLAPALRNSSVRPNEMLKEGTRSGPGGHVRRLKRDFLVVGQVAMALTLVISAGLMIKSFVRISAADPGFDMQRILTMRTRLSGEQYQSAERRIAFFDQSVRKIRSQPGVISAAAVSTLPCDGLDTWDYATIEGYTERQPGSKIFLGYVTVTPAYFETMQIPLVSGRGFTELDNAQGQQVVIVNETLVQKFWPDGGAIGRRLKYGALDSDAPWLTVVGVVGDVKQRGLTRATRLETYRPYKQMPNWRMSFAVRTAGDPLAATAAVQTAVWEVDPDRAVYRVRPMHDIVFDEIGVWGFMAGLLAVFAAIALGLACVGLYGVISYTVSRRTHEIGIRKALGAQSRDIVWLVVARCVLLTFGGVGIGLCLALLSGRALESLMYGVSPTDPSTFVGVAAMLMMVALLAGYVPARRATSVDPMVALRYE